MNPLMVGKSPRSMLKSDTGVKGALSPARRQLLAPCRQTAMSWHFKGRPGQKPSGSTWRQMGAFAGGSDHYIAAVRQIRRREIVALQRRKYAALRSTSLPVPVK